MADEDDEVDFELVTSARQLATPPPLRKEPVTVNDWKTTSGRAARFLVWEVTAADYADFLESGRVYADGQFKRYDNKDEDVRFLAYTLRDQHGNRLWNDLGEAKRQLGQLGKSCSNQLIATATRLNSAKEGAKAGNSDKTENDS